MQFLYPGFLWALLTILIPIIIHLFNFRRYKTVYFSNVQFLQNIRKESKSRSHIKNLLLLLARILAIIFLVLAFARPYIPTTNKQIKTEQSIVGIYLDNSFSMEALGKYGILLENAKMKAHTIANAYNYNTQFILTTNNFELKHQQLVNKDQLTEWISQIKPTHIVRSIKEVQERQNHLFEKADTSTPIHQYILSDFQKIIFNTAEYPSNKFIKQTLVPFTNNNASNVFIDSVWFSTPGHFLGKKETLNARVVNYSSQEISDLQVNLFINDSLKGLTNITIPENNKSIIQLPFVQTKNGINLAHIELSDYPITYDNKLYFNFFIYKRIDVLVLNSSTDANYFNALLNNDQNFNFKVINERKVDYDLIAQNQTLILNELSNLSSGLISIIKEYVANGNRLIIIPSANININDYQKLFSAINGPSLYDWKKEKGQFRNLLSEHPYFKEAIKNNNEKMRLPTYEGYYPVKFNTRSSAQIITETESKNPIIFQEAYHKGDYIFLAMPLQSETTNFATHPLFVPMFYNAALYSTKFSHLYYFLKPPLVAQIKTDKSNGIFKLKNEAQNIEIIPTTAYAKGNLKVFVNENEHTAGHQKLTHEKDTIAGLSFNFDREESKMDSYSFKELESYIENAPNENISLIKGSQQNIEQKIKQQSQGKSLSTIFIWLLLFMLISEILIIKFLD